VNHSNDPPIGVMEWLISYESYGILVRFKDNLVQVLFVGMPDIGTDVQGIHLGWG